MVQESNIAIIGGGASGCICAYFLLKSNFDVTIFDKGSFLRTLLPTGGGVAIWHMQNLTLKI